MFKSLGQSLDRVKNIIHPDKAKRDFVEHRSPIKVREVDETKVRKERDIIFNNQKKIFNYFSGKNGGFVADKDKNNLLISSLCFVYGYDVLQGEEVTKRVQKIKSNNSSNIFNAITFADIYDVFAHLKVGDENSIPSPNSLRQFTVSLKDKYNCPFNIDYNVRDNCRTILLKDFGSYAAMANMIDGWKASPEVVSEVSSDICKSYLDSNHHMNITQEKITSNLITQPQVNILNKAIFTLLTIESQRNPSSIILNAMALDLIADGKKWSDLIITEEASSTEGGKALKRTKSMTIQSNAIQIPMSSKNAVRISESINLSCKNLLAEGEHSNYGSIAADIKESDLKDFINAQGDFFGYWINCKHESLARNQTEGSQSLRAAIGAVKNINASTSYDQIFNCYTNLIEEFYGYFYRDFSLQKGSGEMLRGLEENLMAKKVKLNSDDVTSDMTTSASELSFDIALEVQEQNPKAVITNASIGNNNSNDNNISK